MSDVFKKYLELRLKKDLANVEFCNTELRYLYKRNSNQVVFAVKIPFPVLKFWHEIIFQNVFAEPVRFIDLLEFSIPANAFVFVEDQEIRSQIDENLRKIAASVSQLYKKTKGSARKTLDERSRTYHINEGEIKSIDEWRQESHMLENKAEEWRRKYEDLEAAKQSLYEAMMLEITKKDQQIEQLQKSNAELENYISNLEGSKNYNGKPVSESKNKWRTVNSFLNRAQTALWFAKSYGFDIQGLIIRDQSTGDTQGLNLTKVAGAGFSYDKLSSEEKSKVEKVLYLLDKFCVGDKFYHEIAMIFDSLPKSYLVKQCRTNLNDICHISSLPGPHHGTQISSIVGVIKQQIRDYLNTNKDSFSPTTDKIKIKINGDGAKMTRNSNYVILSFSLLQSGHDVMSAKGNRTIAIVDNAETYETLKESFGEIFQQINHLISNGFIEVDGIKLKTEFFLGGDYKFILLMLGLKSATSDYACAWCKVYRHNRWNMDKSFEDFNKPPLGRTISEIKQMCKVRPNKNNCYNYCCQKEPLIDIELDHIVVDELHLMLRVTDILLENFISSALDQDQNMEIDKVKGQAKNVHLKKAVEHIKSLGIPFDVWEVKNADGKLSGRYDWTSLTGDAKKKLLYRFPQCKSSPDLFGNREICEKVIEIWIKFGELYTLINAWSPIQDPKEFHFKAAAWIKLFTSLNGKMKGFERRRVTPYMHILAMHVPHFLGKYKSIKIFTGQGVEKNNDVARSVVLRKSNKWDSTADILKVESRQWSLRGREREKRAYHKTNTSYWEEEIKNKRQKLS